MHTSYTIPIQIPKRTLLPAGLLARKLVPFPASLAHLKLSVVTLDPCHGNLSYQRGFHCWDRKMYLVISLPRSPSIHRASTPYSSAPFHQPNPYNQSSSSSEVTSYKHNTTYPIRNQPRPLLYIPPPNPKHTSALPSPFPFHNPLRPPLSPHELHHLPRILATQPLPNRAVVEQVGLKCFGER